MDPTRLRAGELLSGAAAIALLVTLFLGWSREGVILSRNTASLSSNGILLPPESGWSSLGPVLAVLVVLVILLGLLLVATTARGRPAAWPIAAAVVTTAVGLLVWLAVAVRVLTYDRALTPAYLGLAFLLLVAVGGWIAMADERKGSRHSVAPDLPRRPAPPAEA